ncbi:MAG: transporter substrate-binding domain-containing protein [Candidatus Poribacteria bacterium]|nr:transporter substrate-binding domain-containing protein [Candidatus Poribacteria bacterium]
MIIQRLDVFRTRTGFGACLMAALAFIFMGCGQLHGLLEQDDKTAAECVEAGRVLKVGFYADFPPVSYSADADPNAGGFNEHTGYEADLLTALEAVDDLGATFIRSGIAEWPGIWLKSAEPEYDLIGGGITILESRTRDENGVPKIAFTSGHITFRQSLLVRAEDADRLSAHAALASDVRVGVLSATTGEARLLQLTGIADSEGVLTKGTRVSTPNGEVEADGTADYMITAAQASPSLEGRALIIPAADHMPQVVYLSGDAELLEALAGGSIDAIARGEIGNRGASHVSGGAFVVTALDDQVEYGGFTLALEDADLLACIDERLYFLTDGGNIGYGEWLENPAVFLERAAMWNAKE